MKDASAKRRSLGKLGIVAAGAIILPLTATVVPAVVAQDKTAPTTQASEPKIVKKQVRIIKINKDGKTVDVINNDNDGNEVTRIERDGKTYVFRTDKKLSQEEVEEMIERAEVSREAAEEARVEAFEARIEAEAARIEADAARNEAEFARVGADQARAAAEMGRRAAIRVMTQTNFASYIPEIQIREITRNCKDGQPVTTNVHGFDGDNKSTIKIVMCGKGQAKLARVEAVKGLHEALREISSEKEMPEHLRKDMIEKLQQQIRKLEAQTDRLD